jgi:hypothetical protein
MEFTEAQENTFNQLSDAAAHQAKACEMTLVIASKVAHSLADFVIVRRPSTIEEITDFIQRMLATNPNIVGSTVAFEPDAFPVLPRNTNDGTLSPLIFFGRQKP